MGKDPPLWCSSAICSGSNAHLSSSTCFFCFRLASLWKENNKNALINWQYSERRWPVPGETYHCCCTNAKLDPNKALPAFLSDLESEESIHLSVWSGGVVDESVLQEGSEHEKYADSGPDVDSLGVGHWRKGVVDWCLIGIKIIGDCSWYIYVVSASINPANYLVFLSF